MTAKKQETAVTEVIERSVEFKPMGAIDNIKLSVAMVKP